MTSVVVGTYHGDRRVITGREMAPWDAMVSAIQRSRARIGMRSVCDPVSGRSQSVVQQRGEWVTLFVGTKLLLSAQLCVPVIDCMSLMSIEETFLAHHYTWDLGDERAMAGYEFARHIEELTSLDGDAALVYARSVGLVTK